MRYLMSKEQKKINSKHAMFAYEYSIDYNATQAAIRAGYSKNTAYSTGQRLLKNVEVQQIISENQHKLIERLERTAENVVHDICMIGRVARSEGNYAIALKALELEGKHLGAFKDKLEVIGNPQAPLELNLSVSPIVQAFLDKIKASE